MGSCYVYILFRPDGSPFYVGKGRKKRILDHGTARSRHVLVNQIIRDAEREGLSCPRVIVQDGLSDEDAFAVERALILAIGRRGMGGPLVNQNDGGHGGRNPSPEVREKIKEARRRQSAPTPEHIERMRASWSGTHLPETRLAISAGLKGKAKSPEHRQKLASAALRRTDKLEMRERMLAARGLRPAEVSPETRAKLAASATGRHHSPEAREKMSAWQRGRKSDPAVNAKRSETMKRIRAERFWGRGSRE